MATSSQRYSVPDLLDMLIILLLATAIVIFVYWMASTLNGAPILNHLPQFITGAYSATWTTIASGGAGIGLIVIRRLMHPDRQHPNYFVYVLGTAVGLIVIIWLVSPNRLPRPIPPPTALLIDAPDGGPARTFRMRSDSPVAIFTYRGTLRRSGGRLTGTVSSKFITKAQWAPPFPMRITSLNVKSCRWIRTGSTWSVDWYPHGESEKDSMDTDIQLEAGKTFDVPELPFDLPWPDDGDADTTWLCLQLTNDSGFMPIPFG